MPGPIALSINNARSMFLLSPFSSFFPGGWVGSEALTHQQVPCSPFISSPFSQLPLIPLLCLFTVHLPCLSFTSLCFFPLQILGPFFPPVFPFGFATSVLFSPVIPLSCVSLLFLPLSLHLTTLHITIVPSCLPLHSFFPPPSPPFTRHFPVSFALF